MEKAHEEEDEEEKHAQIWSFPILTHLHIDIGFPSFSCTHINGVWYAFMGSLHILFSSQNFQRVCLVERCIRINKIRGDERIERIDDDGQVPRYHFDIQKASRMPRDAHDRIGGLVNACRARLRQGKVEMKAPSERNFLFCLFPNVKLANRWTSIARR